MGTTVEFSPRGTFEPLTDLVGGGPFGLSAGQWTDDTSMALCLSESLLERGAFDPVDQLERYVRWYREGHLSSTGTCFDIGNTVRIALNEFERSRSPYSGPTDPMSAGNGSIMRLAPIVLAYFPARDLARARAAESSRTTHGAHEAVDACRILADILGSLLAGESKQAAVMSASPPHADSPGLASIVAGGYRTKTLDEIRGSGYVVDSLEAALWCFWHADDFAGAVLQAANLGDDADTTAAVCGQLAGACWGYRAIPEDWRQRLALGNEIASLADRLFSTEIR